MASFLILGKYTQQGIANMKDSPKRLENARAIVKKHGGELKSFWLSIGRYDFAALAEAPDDAALAKAVLAIAAGGAVSTETLRLFDEAQYKEIVGAL